MTDPVDGRTIWGYLAFALASLGVVALFFGASWMLRVPEFSRVFGRFVTLLRR